MFAVGFPDDMLALRHRDCESGKNKKMVLVVVLEQNILDTCEKPYFVKRCLYFSKKE